jgi:hypothetical protein
MILQQVIDSIEVKGHYKVKINSYNNSIELWSSKGVRDYYFETEAELIAFLKGVYYTQIDMQHDTFNH